VRLWLGWRPGCGDLRPKPHSCRGQFLQWSAHMTWRPDFARNAKCEIRRVAGCDPAMFLDRCGERRLVAQGPVATLEGEGAM